MGDRLRPAEETEELAARFEENLATWLASFEELLDIGSKQIARHYHLDGVPGEKTEGGAEVDVLNTAIPDLEVHVLHYQNPEVGTRYDLVRSA